MGDWGAVEVINVVEAVPLRIIGPYRMIQSGLDTNSPHLEVKGRIFHRTIVRVDGGPDVVLRQTLDESENPMYVHRVSLPPGSQNSIVDLYQGISNSPPAMADGHVFDPYTWASLADKKCLICTKACSIWKRGLCHKWLRALRPSNRSTRVERVGSTWLGAGFQLPAAS